MTNKPGSRYDPQVVLGQISKAIRLFKLSIDLNSLPLLNYISHELNLLTQRPLLVQVKDVILCRNLVIT